MYFWPLPHGQGALREGMARESSRWGKLEREVDEWPFSFVPVSEAMCLPMCLFSSAPCLDASASCTSRSMLSTAVFFSPASTCE